MTMARTETDCEVEFLDIEIVKMKMELLQFVQTMQSKGFLKSVDYEELKMTANQTIQKIDL
ncbi:hypothetical protein SLU01_07560 [Sporosarcina luteola]|uniref:Uncharacterized protein n=1 Tax=Sporosarcina luteola TaxID=582850 RepID=A0A511Z4R9_9BACL|nr:hypothetical protein [Sporosarcina luteola]GEN82444.1 hypothetical protein SLU01_07560 [Sporosarcina luteola]